MMRWVLIGGNVVAVIAAEDGGKVTGIEVRVFPLPYWEKYVLPNIDKP